MRILILILTTDNDWKGNFITKTQIGYFCPPHYDIDIKMPLLR